MGISSKIDNHSIYKCVFEQCGVKKLFQFIPPFKLFYLSYRCPEQVMLCVLPYVADANSLVNIEHKLIEAYCWENSVNLVKVMISTNVLCCTSEI